MRKDLKLSLLIPPCHPNKCILYARCNAIADELIKTTIKFIREDNSNWPSNYIADVIEDHLCNRLNCDKYKEHWDIVKDHAITREKNKEISFLKDSISNRVSTSHMFTSVRKEVFETLKDVFPKLYAAVKELQEFKNG